MKRVDFKRGDEFPTPQDSEEKIELLAYFFCKIRSVVRDENHPHKFISAENVCDLLNDATDKLCLPIEIFYSDGDWAIDCPDEYIKHLPQLIHTFKNLYRFQWRDLGFQKKLQR